MKEKYHPLIHLKTNDVLKSRRIHAVYFLFCGDELLYIGSSTNLKSRIAHHKYLTNYTHFRFIECKGLRRMKYEKRWIRKFKPRYNFHIYGAGPTRSFHNGYDMKNAPKVILKVSNKKGKKVFVERIR